MKELLQAELIKLRTTRTFIALVAVAVGLSLLLTVAVASLADPTQDSVLADVFTSDASSFFILILAIVGMSGEWRHRTITSSLLAAPDRVRFLAAKTLAFAVAGLALSLAISIAIAVAGFAILEARSLPTPAVSDVIDLDLRNAVVALLLGALGVGIGALIRNQAIAIVTILIVIFMVEPVLIGLAPDVGRFGPLSALPTGITNVDPEQIGLGDVDLLDPGLAVLAMLAWIGAAYAASAALLLTRDVD